MAENGGAKWVQACNGWSVQSVLDEMHGLASAAASDMGTYDTGGEKIRVLGRGSLFKVEALSARGLTSAAAQFAGGRTDGNQLGQPNCVLATSAVGSGNEQTTREIVARLALDCATGVPCLLVERKDARRGQVTVQEFVREILLPVLFPDLVAVDHSRDESESV